MLNRVILIGRLVNDPELRYTPSGVANVTFRLAVNRQFKQEGQPEADFISCVGWRQLAETVANYLRKGRLCAVEGRWQTRSYDGNDGKKVYVNECVLDNVRFLESNKESSNNTGNANKDPFKDDGRPIDITEADLPF